ncbi:MAG: tRNA (adenosine(37)-N6)-threonylcarbamoyltransferase complex dimerization subunit type 1 TsaB [Rhodospirillales bacterium]|nr:tRNA (adenosine(37)-N6)-threonylcarbamoyltransferase complex dimerization subunit type 1 TsaB [Rhodospirillales bacterium]
MPLLAFDVAGNACSAAVWSGGEVVAHVSEGMERGQAERLAPMLQSVMDAAALAFSQLQLIAVTVGPGSFTGIRIGLSMAKSLALATGRPLYGVTTFTLHMSALSPAVWRDGPVMIVLETKRDDFYVQMYGSNQQPLGPAAAVPSHALASYVTDLTDVEAVLNLAGDGAKRAVTEMVNTLGPRLYWRESASPDARDLARLAAVEAEARRPPAPTDPFYLRPPDVRRPPATQRQAER